MFGDRDDKGHGENTLSIIFPKILNKINYFPDNSAMKPSLINF